MDFREILAFVLLSPRFEGDMICFQQSQSAYESYSLTFIDGEDNIANVEVYTDSSCDTFIRIERKSPPTDADLDAAIQEYYDGDDESLDEPFMPF